MHMPNKGRAIIYGILTVPIMWLGFSVFAAAALYPANFINSEVLAIIVTAVSFLLGYLILMPIMGIVCAIVVMILAKPFVIFLPKHAESNSNERKK